MPTTTYRVTVGEQAVLVTVRRQGERTTVQVGDGPEREASLTDIHGPLRTLRLDGRRLEVMAQRDGASVEVAVQGVGFWTEVADEARSRLAGLAAGSGGTHRRRDLKAPMPGLVVKVLCAPGDHVEPGQPLVVLQAMKMENELGLPHGGTVAVVNAAPGQTVDQGQVLVTLD